MTGPGNILIVSCYELGHQPLAAASVLGHLRRAGYQPDAVDLAVEPMPSGSELKQVRLIALSVPMHTALRVGVRAARKLREAAPHAHICFYGHYAALNATYLKNEGLADSILGGEVEEALRQLAASLGNGESPAVPHGPVLKRLSLTAPDRRGLPAVTEYAGLEHAGRTVPAAAVETSRGCRFRCRHCPIPPVYDGRFFVIPKESVLEDIRNLVEQGVEHITFADPDFFNGPGHSMVVVRAMHEAFPRLTFDITTKVELILKHAGFLEELRQSGCLFVVTAVESLSDLVLEHLNKGHTTEEVHAALRLLRGAGIAMRPSLVSFTPWTRIEDYLDVLEWIDREGLVGHLDSVQLSIRLLVPPGSALLGTEAMQPHLGELDAARLTHEWTHPDPTMDRLHARISAIVQESALGTNSAEQTFERIQAAAYAALGRTPPPRLCGLVSAGAKPPRLTEPWFC